MGASVSCTDEWNDHYANGNAGNGQSMWSVLEGKEELSNFVKILKATGYDRDLSSSQVFTVFAPTNEQLTDAVTQQYIDDYNNELKDYNNDPLKRAKTATVKEFVQNHIALYNYSASQAMPDTVVRMLNGKYVPFTRETFGGNDFKQANISTGNGVIFTMDQIAKFEPNLFEYVAMDDELKNVSDFLYMSTPYQFHVEKFIPEESVPGEIINGQQHFLDSVTTVRNELLNSWLDASLNNEDSTYYVLLPTNEAWDKELEKTTQYFVYDTKVNDRDSLMYVYPRFSILGGTQFSLTQNPKLGITENIDSIMSTLSVPYNSRKALYGSYKERIYQFQKPYADGGVFTGTNNVALSNGVILKADEWKVNPRNTYLRNIVMEAEGNNTLDSLGYVDGTKKSVSDNQTWTRQVVTTDNPYYNMVSGNTFFRLAPTASVSAGILMDFRNVLSNQEYDLYVTTVPAKAGDIYTTDTLPTRFKARLFYHDINGKEVSVDINDKTAQTDFVKDTYDNLPAEIKETVESSVYRATNDFTAFAPADKVKRIRVGRFSFPTCSYGLDQPQVKLLLIVDIRNPRSPNPAIYGDNLYIDQISLEPVVE